MKKLNIDSFIRYLNNSKPIIPYSSSDTNKCVKWKIKSYTLEFVLEYEVHLSYYISATRDNPEEASVSYEPLEHYDIVLYDQVFNIVELTDKELNLIDLAINNLIY